MPAVASLLEQEDRLLVLGRGFPEAVRLAGDLPGFIVGAVRGSLAALPRARRPRGFEMGKVGPLRGLGAGGDFEAIAARRLGDDMDLFRTLGAVGRVHAEEPF